MSFHEDLRKQAWHMATKERRRPLQASLRRSLSTAYYALFHLLIHEATTQMLGSGPNRAPLRHSIGRAFTHDSMVAVCKSVGSGTLPRAILAVTGPMTLPPDLMTVATTFVKLQDARHSADYDLSKRFLRTQVILLLQEVDTAFEAWARVRTHETSRFFLMGLPLWKQMQR